MLAALLLGWAAVRTAIWQSPFAGESAETARFGEASAPESASQQPLAPRPAPGQAIAAALPRAGSAIGGPASSRWSAAPLPSTRGMTERQPSAASPAGALERATPATAPNQIDVTGRLQQGGGSSAAPAAAPYVAAPAEVAVSRSVEGSGRWSADAWVLWRQDNTTPFLSGRPGYGRSQAGAVVRYDLARSSGHRPQAYLRTSAALEGEREQEAAAGLSARPLPGVPLRVAAELRVGETDLGTKIRPAAYAATELPPVDFPAGLRAELYLQGGYVGGDFATAFLDGQARIERSLLSRGNAEMRAGAGAWAGVQEDASRLDVGPSASLSFGLGHLRARLTADYRFRVAGDAQPGSGPALTLSAGF